MTKIALTPNQADVAEWCLDRMSIENHPEHLAAPAMRRATIILQEDKPEGTAALVKFIEQRYLLVELPSQLGRPGKSVSYIEAMRKSANELIQLLNKRLPTRFTVYT